VASVSWWSSHREPGADADRNHNGYLLRWDDEGLLFDPGEGTQRQMLLAGVRASEITRICLSHFHGDHCLGLPACCSGCPRPGSAPGVLLLPAEGQEYFWRLRHAAIVHNLATIREHPVGAAQPETGPGGAGLADGARRAEPSRGPAR